MLNQIMLDPSKLDNLTPQGSKVWIEVKAWANIQTNLLLPQRDRRVVEDGERQGEVIAVGPKVNQCKPGDWAWFVRNDGQNVTCGERTLTIVPEAYVLMVDDARRNPGNSA